MTEEQGKLLIQIVSQLDYNAVTGEWPHEECKYCSGKSGGYYDSQEFYHDHECPVILIRQLRSTTYEQ